MKDQIHPAPVLEPFTLFNTHATSELFRRKQLKCAYECWMQDYRRIYKAVSEELHRLTKLRRVHQSRYMRSAKYNRIIDYANIADPCPEAYVDVARDAYDEAVANSKFHAWMFNIGYYMPSTIEYYFKGEIPYGRSPSDCFRRLGHHSFHYEWMEWLARTISKNQRITKEAYLKALKGVVCNVE